MREGSRFFGVGWLFLIAVAVVATPATQAQGWFAGASAGLAKQYDYDVGGPIATTDDTDTGFRAFGGYLFHPNMGVVVSWVDLGDAFYAGPAFGGFTDVLGADGFDVSFLGGWAPGSQERVNLFGTVGAFRWKQDVFYVDGSGTYPYKDSGTSLSFGVGAEVNVGTGGRWGIHFEWQRFTNVGDNSNSGHEYDRDLISAGVDFRFGR